MEVQENKKQMCLKRFCAEFDIPRSTIYKWVNVKSFPAYKLGSHWYVDVEEYYKWRRKEHEVSYKYA